MLTMRNLKPTGTVEGTRTRQRLLMSNKEIEKQRDTGFYDSL
jgi:hypothetical protein